MASPKVLLIMGHPRSGTTILNRIMNSHPEIQTTFEFHQFVNLDKKFERYFQTLRKNFWKRRIISSLHSSSWGKRLKSGLFFCRFIWKIRASGAVITFGAVHKSLSALFPGKSVVGDKYPKYIFILPSIAKLDAERVVIYRDCRDVVASFLKKIAKSRNTDLESLIAEKYHIITAKRWVRAIKNMENFKNEIFIIRYEEFVQNPKPILSRLANRLGVDASLFSTKFIFETSVGTYRRFLDEKTIAEIMSVAGQTMQELGYAA